MKIAIYYHGDPDGIVSAAIANKYFNREYSDSDIDFYRCNYGDDIPIIDNYDKLILLDFSFDEEKMKRLIDKDKKFKQFIWIDHHESAIKNLKHISSDVDGIRRNGTAACELTWEYFFGDQLMPWVCKLVGDYDVWKFNYTTTKPFGEVFNIRIHDPTDALLKLMLDEENTDIFSPGKYIRHTFIEEGKYLLRAKEHRVKRNIHMAFLTAFENLPTKVIFTNQDISETGNRLCDDYTDVGMVVVLRKDNISFSLRSKGDINVAKLAAIYGGGGHKNAAGFEMDYNEGLIFIKKLKEDEINV